MSQVIKKYKLKSHFWMPVCRISLDGLAILISVTDRSILRDTENAAKRSREIG